MTGRTGKHWQTILADLALILFIVSASALKLGQVGPRVVEDTQSMALWSADPAGEPLDDWLAAQDADDRLQLVLNVDYRPGHEAVALRHAQRLMRQAGRRPVRLVLEVAPSERITASLHYDGTHLALTGAK